VCDRFADSTRIYQGVLGNVDPRVIRSLERIAVRRRQAGRHLRLASVAGSASSRPITRGAARAPAPPAASKARRRCRRGGCRGRDLPSSARGPRRRAGVRDLGLAQRSQIEAAAARARSSEAGGRGVADQEKSDRSRGPPVSSIVVGACQIRSVSRSDECRRGQPPRRSRGAENDTVRRVWADHDLGAQDALSSRYARAPEGPDAIAGDLPYDRMGGSSASERPPGRPPPWVRVGQGQAGHAIGERRLADARWPAQEPTHAPCARSGSVEQGRSAWPARTRSSSPGNAGASGSSEPRSGAYAAVLAAHERAPSMMRGARDGSSRRLTFCPDQIGPPHRGRPVARRPARRARSRTFSRVPGHGYADRGAASRRQPVVNSSASGLEPVRHGAARAKGCSAQPELRPAHPGCR